MGSGVTLRHLDAVLRGAFTATAFEVLWAEPVKASVDGLPPKPLV